MSNTFNVILRSASKTSGSNNDATFQVPFSQMNKYKKLMVRSTWWNKTADYTTVTGGYTKHFCEVRVNFNSDSYDSRDGAVDFLTLGVANLYFNGSGSNMRYTYDTGDCFQHIIDFPTSDFIKVQIRAVLPQASGNKFFVMSNGNTNDLADCSEHVLFLQFTGLDE